MAYKLGYSGYTTTPSAVGTGEDYKLHYSDYPGTVTGPPDPARWIGPPGPPGPQGEPGPPGPAGGGYTLPTASTTILGGVKVDGATINISGSGVISSAAVGGVTSWNARTGVVTLTTADVTTALTYTPYNSTNPAGYQTAAQVTTTVNAAQRYLNYADNSGFSVNQRNYVSGTALAAGIYGLDRWKAGASGCTLTFTGTPPATTITITAGSLQQVVEGNSIAGGNYALSWAGTAQGRVGAGSYTASPVAVAGATAGANITIEFNTGTLGQVKFEAGTVATPWQLTPVQTEAANCQRYYQVGQFLSVGYGLATATVASVTPLPTTMRASPLVVPTTTTNANCSAATNLTTMSNGVAFQTTVTATAAMWLAGSFTASADL